MLNRKEDSFILGLLVVFNRKLDKLFLSIVLCFYWMWVIKSKVFYVYLIENILFAIIIDFVVDVNMKY